MKSSQLFHFIKTHSSVDICEHLTQAHLSNEKLYNQVVINRLMRDYEVVSFILSQFIPFTDNQLHWISQTRYIQKIPENREAFEQMYGVKVSKKRLSINALNTFTRKNDLAINNNAINRTIKIGAGVEYLDQESYDWLHTYLQEWQELEHILLTDIYRIFKEDPEKILANAAQISYIRRYQEEKAEYQEQAMKDENEVPIIFPIAGQDQEPYYVYQIRYKNRIDDKNSKTEYIASNNQGVDIKVQPDDAGGYQFKAFKGQDFYNNVVAPKYFTLKPTKDKYKTPFYQDGLNISYKVTHIHQLSQLKETLGKSVADTVCSFLDKYYEAISEVDKTYRANKKIWEENQQKIHLLQDQTRGRFLSQLTYPEPITSPETRLVEQYNAFITTYNQLLNEKIWQNPDGLFDVKKTPKKEFKKLERLKGVPSFPTVEREQVRNYDQILERIKHHYQDIWQRYQQEKDQFDYQSHSFCTYLQRKSSAKGKYLHEAFSQIEKRYNLERDSWKQLLISSDNVSLVFQDLITYFQERITEYDLDTLETSDITEIRDLADIYAQYVTLLAHVVFDIQSQEYYDFRIDFNTLLGLLKAQPFEGEKIEKHQINFAGFSAKDGLFQKGLAIACREEGGKIQLYAIFNLHENIHLRFTERETEYRALAYQNGQPELRYIDFDDKPGTIVLPLLFGTRIGRRYFYHDMCSGSQGFNQLEFLTSGMIKFQNARLIQETYPQKTDYFFAIATEKQTPLVSQAKSYDYDSLIGVDMGEKIPAVLAQIDRETNQILGYNYLHQEMDGTLHTIQKRKDESQRQYGYIPEKLRNKITNITQTLLEDIAVESLEQAITQRSLLVSEDLSRGFGRGNSKGTYVWMRQYTKLNDILFHKAYELGMANKQPVTNSENGILAKVPAANTSKLSLQTGFVLRSPGYWQVVDEDITDAEEVILEDDLGSEVVFNLETFLVTISWRGYQREVSFLGTRKELGSFIADTEKGEGIFSNMMYQVFERRDSNSQTRRKQIVSLVYNLLNPRKTQEAYIDIFTGKAINADIQGAVNVARSFNWTHTKHYKKEVKGKLTGGEKLRKYQDWYQEHCIDNQELPSFIYL